MCSTALHILFNLKLNLIGCITYTYCCAFVFCGRAMQNLIIMTVITYTRDAKCKDCEFIRYFYQGKRKLHYCIQREHQLRLNDPICGYFVMRKEYYPNRLTDRSVGK